MADLMTDSKLLAEFVHGDSSQAFAGLVRRYVDLVYGTAKRMVGDAHQAEDVTQAAFVVLIKKAKMIDPSTLPGWLVNTTRLCAREAMRSRIRRQTHERRAAGMRGKTEDSQDSSTVAELTPFLDDALSQLNASDRSAVVMRFLQGLTFAEVGRAMGSTEEAARKRVERAVDKLRAIFMQEGLFSSVGGLMLAMASQQGAHAPATLATSLSAIHTTGGTSTALILAKGALWAMWWGNMKMVGMVLLGLFATGGLGVGVETIHRAITEAPVATIAVISQVSPVDLLARYPTQLTTGDDDPTRARPWDFTAGDIFYVAHFRLESAGGLKVEMGPADLGIGHCVDGAVWAVLIPREGGTLSSQMKGQEAISNVWLRFHPKEIDHLFPPETVFDGGGTDLLGKMRAVAHVKMISSWQAYERAMIPVPSNLIVDVDVKAGARRFFNVDTKLATVQYYPVFENRFVPPLIVSSLDASPKPPLAATGVGSRTGAADSLSFGIELAGWIGGLFCLLAAIGMLAVRQHKARRG